jgi:hypothetical protein
MSSGDSFLASRKKDVGGPLIETGLAQIGNWNPKESTNDGKEKVKTQRKPASAQMLVSSTDRYATAYERVNFPNKTTAANWILNNQRAALYGYFTRICLTQIQWQWNTPTIVEGKNDLILLDIVGTAGGLIFPTIAPGFYSPSGLAEEMQNAIQATPQGTAAGVTVTYLSGEGVNSRFRFTAVTAGYTLAFRPAVEGTQPGSDNKVINATYITIGATVTNTPSNAIETGVPTMLYSRYYDVLSTKLTTYQKVKDACTNPYNTSQEILARVYATPPNVATFFTQYQAPIAPYIMNISYPEPKWIRWTPNQSVYDFDIRVIDEYGEPMYWSATYPTEYQMTFLASED